MSVNKARAAGHNRQDLQHFTTQVGHFMAEEAPEDIATLLLNLVKR
ncbi:hypothetical protein [Streptomyces sp. NPDC007856]